LEYEDGGKYFGKIWLQEMLDINGEMLNIELVNKLGLLVSSTRLSDPSFEETVACVSSYKCNRFLD
jgi:hypothetical protein